MNRRDLLKVAPVAALLPAFPIAEGKSIYRLHPQKTYLLVMRPKSSLSPSQLDVLRASAKSLCDRLTAKGLSAEAMILDPRLDFELYATDPKEEK